MRILSISRDLRFVWVNVFNYLFNVIYFKSNGKWRFVWFSWTFWWKFAAVVEKCTFLSKVRIKDFSYLSEICNKLMFMKNWRNNIFLLFKNVFKFDQYVLGVVLRSNIFLLPLNSIFQPAWMHLRCIFETSHTTSQRHLKEGWFANLWKVSCKMG